MKLKGIGRWTAEMFLIFTLRREDIFSTGDLGLQNAIAKHYRFKVKPKNEDLNKISLRWSPYRSLASRILWKSLELKD
jgi:DNA-3-methyladenine glycosylase II